MAIEGRDRLFSPFERLDAASTGIEGSGVGLALSKSLVEAMGGTIGADSEPGVGSTFWVELPAAAATVDVTLPSAADRGPAVRSPEASGDGMFVLYVEDNLANVGVMERLVRDRPERLEVVLQGGLAVELAARLQPGLVLLDLHLPDVSGETVLHRLKSDPATAQLPVVILSADVSAGGMRRLVEMGALAFLPKPIDIMW